MTWLNATAQARLIRRDEVSRTRLTEAAIARIEAVNSRPAPLSGRGPNGDGGDVGVMADRSRAVLPIPQRRHVGLTTYDAKDPDTSFPPIEPLRPPPATVCPAGEALGLPV